LALRVIGEVPLGTATGGVSGVVAVGAGELPPPQPARTNAATASPVATPNLTPRVFMIRSVLFC
jgi:hypothetical protein